MSQIIISRQAQYDLDRIYVFLGEKDIRSAQSSMVAISKGFSSLANTPTLWRTIEGGLREYLVDFGKGGYTVLYDYQVETDRIDILAIRHQAEENYKWL